MPCPTCHNPAQEAFAPFCSKVCKNIDLIRWFQEGYRIPTQEPVTGADGEEQEEGTK